MNWKTTVAWEPIQVPSADKPWEIRLRGIIADLDVERALRYKPHDEKTFCNIYANDIIANMGIAAPRHWMTSGGDPAKVGQGIEMSANRLVSWFKQHGGRYGWWSADEGTAVSAAERGHLVIAIMRGDERKPGHIAIVLGEKDNKTRISQAGAHNFAECDLQAGFGNRPVEFWIQAERGGEPHAK